MIINNILYYNRKHNNSNTGEFYMNNPIQRVSMTDSILLVVKNLKEKQLLTNSLNRYFIQLSISFKEYDLFHNLLQILKPSALIKLKWQYFYFTLPLRLFLFGKWKKIKKFY